MILTITIINYSYNLMNADTHLLFFFFNILECALLFLDANIDEGYE